MIGHQSVVELGDFVIEGCLHASGVVGVELGQFGQSLHTVAVSCQGWVVYEKLALTNKSHQLTQLEKSEINVGDIVSHNELFLSEIGDNGLDSLQKLSSDSGSVSICVAGHRDGTLEVGDLARDHLDFANFFCANAEKLRSKLIGDVLHDGVGLSQLKVAVKHVGQVGELESKSLFRVQPARSVEVRGITLLVLVLSKINAKVHHLVSDLRGKSSDFPVAKGRLIWVCVDLLSHL